MFDPDDMLEMKAELDTYIAEALVGKPALPVFPEYLDEPNYADVHELLPSEDLLSLLTTLERYARFCPGNSKTFAYAWNNAMRLRNLLAPLGCDVQGQSVLEIGSGIYNPVGASMILLAQGASRCVSFDTFPPQVDWAPESTLRTYTESCGLFPAGAERLGQAVNPFILAQGQFDSALDRSLLSHTVASAHDFDDPEPFDIMHSNAVLEHFLDYEACVANLARLTKPGGIHVHKIDFTDHDFYAIDKPTETSPFEFLFVNRTGAVGDQNRLRLPEIIELFARHGLSLLQVAESWSKPFPEDERPNLAEQYRDMSNEDLSTTCATVILKKG